MHLKLPNKNTSAFLLLTAVYFCVISTSVFAGGRRVPPPSPSVWRFARSVPSVKPEWIESNVPQNGTEISFVGISQVFDTEADARNNARAHAQNQVLEYYGLVLEHLNVFIEKEVNALTVINGNMRETVFSYISNENEIKAFAQNVVSGVETVAYYTEVYINNNSRKEGYKVYSLHRINRQKADHEIAAFPKNISERYTLAIPQWNTLKAALEGYAFIVKSLERNPLHRIVAYYETPRGRAGLYEYARLQINELANSVSIEAIPFQTIYETETLSTRINLRSSVMPITGPLDCQARVSGMTYPFNSASDNPYNLQIPNMKLGTYNVTIEILLANLTGGIARNSSSSFSFEVTPLIPLHSTREEIEAGIRRAVDTLALRLQSPTETSIGLFTIKGTNIPSEFSVFLTGRITHYAKNNQGRKYLIVEGVSENRAVLSGFFIKRNDRVDVTLELSTPGRERDGSQIFSISLDVLEQIGLSVEPKNIATIIPLDTIIPVPAMKSINIEAGFNSNTRTYRHRDKLELTVKADKDCYFKVIHIDVNNQMKMIFPNAYDQDNHLFANTPRTIFEKSRYSLYDPYGAEIILLVASKEQFRNIESEYILPWVAATTESIRSAIRGGDLELAGTMSFNAEGEERYTITILEPDEKYHYTRPPNMTEFVQAIQRQGESFDGDETSGYTIQNNVRLSYRIPRNAPDTIQIAIYHHLDRHIGLGFSFSFERPGNMRQTIQTLRSNIERKDGTFTGNEQQGNFKVNGIMGQYRVSDSVNITITEKPVLIPNSLIEREVRAYFGIR